MLLQALFGLSSLLVNQIVGKANSTVKQAVTGFGINGGYVTNWKRIDYVHLTDHVYQALRDRILDRVIKSNEQVNIEEIAEELGVSRTPVVDALKRLANEGLVEVKARRGTYVKAITEQDLHEIFQIREALELFAVQHVLNSPEREAVAKEMRLWLDRMEPLGGEGEEFHDHVAFSEADKAFHRVLILACNNQRMLNVYDSLNLYMYIMRGHRVQRFAPPSHVQADHIAMCEAVEKNDMQLAEKAIKEHLADVRQRLLTTIRSNGGIL